MKSSGSLLFALSCVALTWGRIDPPDHYVNEWVVRIKGGETEAQRLAKDLGYTFMGQVLGFNDTFSLIKDDHPHKSPDKAKHFSQELLDEDTVLWAEQQGVRNRTKRSLWSRLENFRNNIFETNHLGFIIPSADFLDNFYEDVADQFRDRRSSSGGNEGQGSMEAFFNDPEWKSQWYMSKGATGNAHGHDMNVIPCYKKGITGKGIRVTVLDDGLYWQHPDLKPNYDAEISYDINGNDDDPTPRSAKTGSNAHGTRCAGEIAMAANNNNCGVGIAFNSRIGGVRMLDGPVSDRVEATALGYAHELTDIYSASWGPTDNGKTLDGPGVMTVATLERGAKEGRGGKGNIFVWASGNGGPDGDSCSCDGYVNNLYTLGISSATQGGRYPWYAEECSAVFATAFSSGWSGDKMIVGPDFTPNGPGCTTRHSGTSAAAPIAAGVIALALEANPNLTWRDVQHIITRTARPQPLMSDGGWFQNAGGRYYNTRFGFGLLNAYGMVKQAQKWKTVPESMSCNATGSPRNPTLYRKTNLKIPIDVDCPDMKYLEHVQLTINVQNQNRGRIQIYLLSPQGTSVQVMHRRPHDTSVRGYNNWTLLSVASWNENPNGRWVVDVMDTCESCTEGKAGTFTLTVHGTQQPPFYMKNPQDQSTISSGPPQSVVKAENQFKSASKPTEEGAKKQKSQMGDLDSIYNWLYYSN